MLLRLLMQIIVSVMNEDLKNIETCLPESILAEVASVPTDPQFVSLVNESLDPLKQQAVQQAGSDAYNEVVASHQPYTFTSSVRQMKSNLILLLRSFWRFPFGTGTIRSLSDMWAHYITRLHGSETYGIQSRLDQLTDLPSAPLLVADRKISEPNAIDGISLIRLLCDSTAAMTEFEDTNYGWTFNKTLPAIFAYEKITLRCKEISFNPSEYSSMINSIASLTTLEFPELVTADFGSLGSLYQSCANITRISFPELVNVSTCNNPPLNSSTIEEIDMPKLDYIKRYNIGCITGWSAIKKLRVHHPNFDRVYPNVGDLQNMPNLIHLEFGADMAKDIYLPYWSPTLDSSNLQQFLSNFRSFIVLRLANRKTTTALTLTLSANVYNAVTGANSGWASQHTLAELGITDNDLTDLETELGITTATIYASWLDTYTGANGIHWDINKAN